ncbi:hypothetical protein NBG89_09145 [Rhizobium sp. YTU87027]
MSEKAGNPHAYPPRGLGRFDAARYLGLGLSLFDTLVKEGRLPPPKQVNKRVIWDRVALDVAFESLPDQEQDTRSAFQKLLDSRPVT